MSGMTRKTAQKIYLKIKKLIPAMILLAGINFSFSLAAPTAIEKLTSKKNAQKQEQKQNQVSLKRASLSHALQKHSLGLGVGQTFIFHQLGDSGKDKITWDLLYNYSASYSFDFLAGFHYSKHYKRGLYSVLSGLTVGIKGKFFHFDAFAPYGVLGVGFYSPQNKRCISQCHEQEENARRLEVSESNVVFGIHGGFGGDLRLNEKYTVGIFAQYHNPFDMQQDVGPDVEGSYFKLLMTLLYTF